MADVLINHALVSTKPDSSDGSLVSSSEWNASALLSGGLQGQLVARSAGSLTGGSWVDGAKVSSAVATYTGPSPSGNLCTISLTFNTVVNLLFMPGIVGVTSGGATIVTALIRDGGTIAQFTAGGAGVNVCWPFFTAETPGTHIYTINAAATSGTFNSLGLQLVIFGVGVA